MQGNHLAFFLKKTSKKKSEIYDVQRNGATEPYLREQEMSKENKLSQESKPIQSATYYMSVYMYNPVVWKIYSLSSLLMLSSLR